MENNKTMQGRISALLMEMGAVPALKGFHYLKEAIMLAVDDEYYAMNITTAVYPHISQKYSISVFAAERAIRLTINKSWNARDKSRAEEVFRSTLQGNSDIPTNSMFIASLAEWLKYNSDLMN
ncbi:MAG: sporulation initiation factor Spo0A C-terminal domain-containing protein [Ruminococcus sp.]|nr:sporulation initiation factor Spo0A C-terminal domain-containing protein [Ruminococcus sp.]